MHMNLLASSTHQDFPQGWETVSIIIFFLVWISGITLQFVINRNFKKLLKEGVEGLPETLILHQSIGFGMDRFDYFYKKKYKATKDSQFIMLCEIYRFLFLLIGLMLIGFIYYFSVTLRKV